MCGRFTLTPGLTILQRRFSFAAEQLSFNPRYNLAPGQNAPVVVGEGARMLKLMRWGHRDSRSSLLPEIMVGEYQVDREIS